MLQKLAEARYDAGAGNAVELSDAIVQLSTTQGTLIRARFNLSVARAQLLRALGRR